MNPQLVLSKIDSIGRYLERIKQHYDGELETLTHNFDAQDIIILNLLRACEQTLDLANHTIKTNNLKTPTSARDSFAILASSKIIDHRLAEQLGNMTGFRNLATHQYHQINMEILKSILDKQLNDFQEFSKQIAGLL
ncbi:MAG: DUF86 domain-containing protein [Bacteroidota bacterium]